MTLPAKDRPLSDDERALLEAADRGDIETIERVIAAGVDVDVTDPSGRTALHLAAPKHGSCVRLLLDAGAHPEARTRSRSTPLHGACLRATMLLLQRGVDVNATTSRGTTPLHRAKDAVAQALAHGIAAHQMPRRALTAIPA